MIRRLIILLLIVGCDNSTNPVVCEEGFTNVNNVCQLCNEGYTEIDSLCYYQDDLDVLQQFIDNSQGGDNPPPSDLLPIDLGDVQEWEDGRLIRFRCMLYNHLEYGYELSGGIPQQIGSLTKLYLLDLSRNKLNGIIPAEIGDLLELNSLKLYSNELNGEIPPEVSNLVNLEWFYLHHNELSGHIPESICNLNIDFSSTPNFGIKDNNLCPPYPSCIEQYVGEQDTSNCH